MTPQILQQGAEAVIILKGNEIVKQRIKKSYRIPELDEKIRKSRTKSEAKLLEKASKIIDIPKLIKVDEKNKEIVMEFINGKKLSDSLNSFPVEKQLEICKIIGESVAKLHDENIIHGDLTTSNMILFENKNPASQKDKRVINKKTKDNTSLNSKDLALIESSRKIMAEPSVCMISPQKQECGHEPDFEQSSASDSERIFFIDFGLGLTSFKIEDKAVDLHLLKQALEAKHFQNWEKLFDAILKGYSLSKNYKIVLERLKAVEKRGRYKH